MKRTFWVAKTRWNQIGLFGEKPKSVTKTETHQGQGRFNRDYTVYTPGKTIKKTVKYVTGRVIFSFCRSGFRRYIGAKLRDGEIRKVKLDISRL